MKGKERVKIFLNLCHFRGCHYHRLSTTNTGSRHRFKIFMSYDQKKNILNLF